MHRAGRKRRTLGMAALLPALLLAAVYVAAPFAGTTTHAVSWRAPSQQAHAERGVQARTGQRGSTVLAPRASSYIRTL